MAPEMLDIASRKHDLGHEADVYSFGVIMCEIMERSAFLPWLHNKNYNILVVRDGKRPEISKCNILTISLEYTPFFGTWNCSIGGF